MFSTEPKMLIVGPGALGGLFAARIGRRRHGVYLLDHREDRAAKLQESGLHVTGATLADWTLPPGRASTRAAGWPVMDVVFFFVKAPMFAAAWKEALPVIGPETALVVFPEAVDLSALKKRSRQLIVALTDDRARMEGMGRVFHESTGDTRLDGTASQAKAVAGILKEAGIPVVLDKKIRELRWVTLLAQVCVDVPTALADAPQKSLLEPPLSVLGDRLMLECVALAKALKRPVSAAALKTRRDALIAKAPDAKSPLGRDLLRGRPTERAALLDPLLAAGKDKAPLLADMDRLLRRLEKEGPIP